MKKIDPPPICQICTARITDYGFMCFEIMEEVCRCAVNHDTIYYHEIITNPHLKEIIKILETKGLLISTEIDNFRVVIKPNNKQEGFGSQDITFCWCENR